MHSSPVALCSKDPSTAIVAASYLAYPTPCWVIPFSVLTQFVDRVLFSVLSTCLCSDYLQLKRSTHGKADSADAVAGSRKTSSIFEICTPRAILPLSTMLSGRRLINFRNLHTSCNPCKPREKAMAAGNQAHHLPTFKIPTSQDSFPF